LPSLLCDPASEADARCISGSSTAYVPAYACDRYAVRTPLEGGAVSALGCEDDARAVEDGEWLAQLPPPPARGAFCQGWESHAGTTFARLVTAEGQGAAAAAAAAAAAVAAAAGAASPALPALPAAFSTTTSWSC
jgi:hypothetical protein